MDIIGWGSTFPGHLLPTDPGHWSSADSKKFSTSLESISTQLQPGWEVITTWHVLATDDDAEGWKYALDFASINWYPKEGTGLSVRKRAWRREIALKSIESSKINTNNNNSTIEITGNSTSVNNNPIAVQRVNSTRRGQTITDKD